MDTKQVQSLLTQNLQALMVAKFELSAQGAAQLAALVTANRNAIQELGKEDGDDADAD